MIVNLSAFFRSSLALDPSEDVTLAEEIEFQQLYLDIEKVALPEAPRRPRSTFRPTFAAPGCRR